MSFFKTNIFLLLTIPVFAISSTGISLNGSNNISGITFRKNKRYFIEFKGINWKSDIYFNGKLLGKIEGAFQRANFEIMGLINADGKNALAVLVHHIENWQSGKGKVTRKYLGAPTTNGDVSGLDSSAFLPLQTVTRSYRLGGG